MTLTMQVAQMVADASYEDLAPEIIEKVKLLILDQLGCMIAGSVHRESLRLASYLEEIDPGGEATVFGACKRMTPPNAAHANAQAGTMLSLDDSYIRYGHPGNSLLPAAFAVAELLNASGPELILSAMCGYEMSMRLGLAISASVERDQKVKGYSSWQVFGATSATAKLRRLSAEEIAGAYGLTAMHAPPPYLRKLPLNWLKNNYGWANKAGITSVDLTIAGYEGNREIFDGEFGYWIIAGSDQFDPDVLVTPFAERSIVKEIGFKPYSGCRWSHTPIDCIRNLIKSYFVTHEGIDRITIETAHEFVRDLNSDVWPDTVLDALLNIPYLVALELHGKSSALGLSDQDLKREDIAKTVEKITMTVLPGAQERFFKCGMVPVRVTLHTKDGRVLNEYAEYPKGHPNGPPFARKDVVAKFLGLTTPVIRRTRAERLCNGILDLERHTVKDVMRIAYGDPEAST
ncbi:MULTISPECIES: MmgE/PrpD family protein [unclassified Sinorhizobium]|uniref:MmgE/PrpD family protein n=1 Tax=unclassified Sinorhizobium TaxID=2613772 RepID=UPI0024C2F852|nr:MULTISPECIES: MmgE/PrpD family protein [unclassified Sinorhizobium]MDK1481725.1 MmgE/PrpD family protein [Sinorhizobium sp. 6-117]